MKEEEYLSKPDNFEYLDMSGNLKKMEIMPGELAFTYCQVPIVYSKGTSRELSVDLTNGKRILVPGSELTKKLSWELFSRTGKMKSIRVSL